MLKFYQKAFTIIEIMVVLAVAAILLAVALPNFLKSSKISTKTICINNLKHIDAAVDQWATDYNIPPGTLPADSQEDAVYGYVKGGKPKCPSGGEYTIHAVGSKPQASCGREESEGHKLPE